MGRGVNPLESGQLLRMLQEQAGVSSERALRGDYRGAWTSLHQAVRRYLEAPIMTVDQAQLARIADACERIANKVGYG